MKSHAALRMNINHVDELMFNKSHNQGAIRLHCTKDSLNK